MRPVRLLDVRGFASAEAELVALRRARHVVGRACEQAFFSRPEAQQPYGFGQACGVDLSDVFKTIGAPLPPTPPGVARKPSHAHQHVARAHAVLGCERLLCSPGDALSQGFTILPAHEIPSMIRWSYLC